MNAEYLLDAIGQLDDDLIREAERYRRPRARYGRLMGLAACFAVAVALGYVLTHIGGMNGGSAPSYSAGGGNGGAPASGNSAPSTSDGADTQREPEQPLGSASSSQGGENAEAPDNGAGGEDAYIWVSAKPLSVSVRLDENRLLNSTFFEARVLDELPEGCVELGRLRLLDEAEETGVPYTDDEDYVGCPVWLLADGPETFTFYIELPIGGYLASG